MQQFLFFYNNGTMKNAVITMITIMFRDNSPPGFVYIMARKKEVKGIIIKIRNSNPFIFHPYFLLRLLLKSGIGKVK